MGPCFECYSLTNKFVVWFTCEMVFRNEIAFNAIKSILPVNARPRLMRKIFPISIHWRKNTRSTLQWQRWKSKMVLKHFHARRALAGQMTGNSFPCFADTLFIVLSSLVLVYRIALEIAYLSPHHLISTGGPMGRKLCRAPIGMG